MKKQNKPLIRVVNITTFSVVTTFKATTTGGWGESSSRRTSFTHTNTTIVNAFSEKEALMIGKNTESEHHVITENSIRVFCNKIRRRKVYKSGVLLIKKAYAMDH